MHLYLLSYINFSRACIGLSSIFSIFDSQSVIFAEKLVGNLINFKIRVYGSHGQIVKTVQWSINTYILHNLFLHLGFSFFELGSNLN